MIGCEDAAEVVTRIGALSRSGHLSCSGKEFARVVKPVKISAVEVIRAEKVKKTEMDKGGYFVILPLKEKGIISVEHYSNDNRLLRIIEGTGRREPLSEHCRKWLGHSALPRRLSRKRTGPCGTLHETRFQIRPGRGLTGSDGKPFLLACRDRGLFQPWCLS